MIGSGSRGHRDDAFDEATFSSPQGMALHEDVLYVADTENHMIRRLNLVTKKVSTLAGTGRQGTTVVVRSSKRPTSQDLASPWDLTIHGSWLYIAMAGTHQIWRMSLHGTSLHTYAGSGAEDIVDGPLRPRRVFESGVAAFAQPSGLTADREYLYVADTNNHLIRVIDIETGKVKTLALDGLSPPILGSSNEGRGQE